MNNQELLNQKDKFDTHSILVQKFMMDLEGIPRHNVSAATKWLNERSTVFREMAEEIYTSENPEDEKIRDEILSDNEADWKKAADEMEKMFKVHA